MLFGSDPQLLFRTTIPPAGLVGTLSLVEHMLGDIIYYSNGTTQYPICRAYTYGSTPQRLFYASDSSGTQAPYFRSIEVADLPNSISKSKLALPPDYIDGLTLSFSSTVITITEGSAYVLSGTSVVSYVGGTITSSRANNTWYHIYLNSDGTVTRSTTAPGASYYRSAKRSGTTNSTRYIGSVRTDASGNYMQQRMDVGANIVNVTFLRNEGADGRISNSGGATSQTDLSALALGVPITATMLSMRLHNNIAAGGPNLRIYGWNGSSFVLLFNLSPTILTFVEVPCDTTPKVQYDYTAAGGSIVSGVVGYTYER